jgi:hypothetical protein
MRGSRTLKKVLLRLLQIDFLPDMIAISLPIPSFDPGEADSETTALACI